MADENDEKTQELAVHDPDGVIKTLATALKSGYSLTAERKMVFLGHLAQTGRVTASAAKAGVSRKTVYKARDNDPEFKKAWELAYVMFQEKIEERMTNIALYGVQEPVFFQGEECGTKPRIIPQITLAHARRHIEAYREKQEISVDAKNGGVLVVPGMVKDAGPPATEDGRSQGSNDTWAIDYSGGEEEED